MMNPIFRFIRQLNTDSNDNIKATLHQIVSKQLLTLNYIA